MFANKTSRNYVKGLLLFVSLCVAACGGIAILANISEESASQSPVKTLIVTIEASQRDDLFDQLQKFADKHAFEYHLTDYAGQGKHFLAEILGDNVKILTLGISDNSKMFSIRFYAPSPGDPPPDKQVVDDLAVDLKNFLIEIPNIEIIEEK